jgi:1-acyl-sn-glycerol-3-phosphate acyltransferase
MRVVEISNPAMEGRVVEGRVALPTAGAPVDGGIARERAEPAFERDPEFIRRVLPAIERYTSYFSPEVRGLDQVPASGPVLLVGNHSGVQYMPDMWVVMQAVLGHRGIEAPTYGLLHQQTIGAPVVGPFMRRLGAIPAGSAEAVLALRQGAAVLVYPGGDREGSRPWTERNRIELHGHHGFVRLALQTNAPVIPVVAHGSHHAVIVLSRGDRLAHALGLERRGIKVLPLLFGFPFGVSLFPPPLPMPAKVTVEILPPLDWTGHGSNAADDPDLVAACYDQITTLMQSTLDRLNAECPHPVVTGSADLIRAAATSTVRGPLRLLDLFADNASRQRRSQV